MAHPKSGTPRGADPTTQAVRLTGNIAAAATLAFLALFIVSSEIGAIRRQSPWAEDPWDGVMSVAALVVPVVALITWLRVQRWRAAREMPATARRLVLRGIFIALVLIDAGLAAAWQALLSRQGDVPPTSTPALVVGLLVPTTLAAIASVALGLTWGSGRRATSQSSQAPDDGCDALGDAMILGGEALGWLTDRLPAIARPTRRAFGSVESFVDGSRLSPRAHPLGFGLVVGVGFGIGFSTWHSLVEGAPSDGRALAVWAIYALIGAAIAVGAYLSLGRYLRLVSRT